MKKKTGKKLTACAAALALMLSFANSAVSDAYAADGICIQGSLGREIKLGDVNNDGRISPADTVMALRLAGGQLAETELSAYAADVDGDGEITETDAQTIFANALGVRDDGLGICNLEEVTYEVPEAFRKDSDFLKEEQASAFYGADGFGKYTTGGRGGKVIAVTNLNDSGEGSLRAALAESGPRVIVFRVSGNILLESELLVENGDVTIAGETAPGDGISVLQYPLTLSGCDNVIIRYINFRSGDYVQAMGQYDGEEYGYDSLSIFGCKDVMIDHCTAAWGTDETLSVTVNGHDSYEETSDRVTVQWSVVADSLVHSGNVARRLGLGSLICGTNGSHYTFHHNLYACHASRMPEMSNSTDYKKDDGGFEFEFINNVVYGWTGRAAGKSPNVDGNGEEVYVLRYDYINNYYLSGNQGEPYMLSEDSYGNQLYAEGNEMNGSAADQKQLVTFDDDILAADANPYYKKQGLYLDPQTYRYQGSADFDYSYFKEGRFEDTQMRGVQSAGDAYTDVMEMAGSSLSRDSLDIGLFAGVEDGTARTIDYPFQAPGWPTGKPQTQKGEEYGEWLRTHYPQMASYTPYEDSDGDGMSDAWEDFMNLDKQDASDGSASYLDSSYTNLDVFLQFLIEHPQAAIG